MKRLFLLALAVFAPLAARADDRPNILWIFLEDVSGWFSCYGDEVIETPHIDSLAEGGTRFTRFYTPAGVCSATRSAIATGMMQTSINAHHHRSARANFRGQSMGEYDRNELPSGVVPIAKRFRNAGYWTFNEGGKDDFNYEWSRSECYDWNNQPWGPEKFLAGETLAGKPANQPFFGQIQLAGGKLDDRMLDAKTDPAKVPVPPYYPDVPETREYIAQHYDCLVKTDEQVGEILAKLDELGLRENTLIFLFSDHGMGLHRHKQFLYEGGIHMPLIVAGPGIESGQVRDDLVSGIDLTAATLAAAGLDVPSTMEGRDFLAAGHEPRAYVVAARDRCDYTIERIRALVTPRFKYLRNGYPELPFMQPSYKDEWKVSKRYREIMADGGMNETQLVFFGPDKAPEELYDLENDPHEIHNLAADPAYAEALAEHRRLLDEWIARTGDKGQQPESDLGLLCALKRWGDLCTHPEYDRVRHLLEKKD